MVSPASSIPSDKQRTYEQLIDALQVLFGKHHGFRPVHAKGVLCERTQFVGDRRVDLRGGFTPGRAEPRSGINELAARFR